MLILTAYINLDYDRDVYIGKDTVVAYVEEEDVMCIFR